MGATPGRPGPQDFGYPQSTATEMLKSHIFEAPAPIDDGTPAIVKALQAKVRRLLA